ncbi:MAG: hypothetical protein SNF33_04295 [Candidatus Algichlamydia australiensis]|nr:hypothetical protein [Chlamydiales bacterium]
MRYTLALMGETEKGEYGIPYRIASIPELADKLGNPPENSCGISFAIQALLYERLVLFIRVPNEGYSKPEYMRGLYRFEEESEPLSALCMPGVADEEIIRVSDRLLAMHHALLITTEQDLYDYLTN